MKIADIALYKYELPLIRPLTIKGHTINTQCGVIVSIIDKNGFVGLGDAAPLPGLHDESLENVIAELVKIKGAKELMQMSLPSARFAAEGAMLDLAIQSEKTFNSLETLQVPVNALLSNDGGDILDEFSGLCDMGFSAIKVKVGRKDVRQDIELIKSLKELNRNVTLRLDANRAWKLEEALEFCTQVGAGNVEYIEEPVANPKDRAKFIKASPIPLALDETLVKNDIRKIDLEGVKAMVLKPQVLGGFEATTKLINIAKEKGVLPVLSSAFESGIGIRSIALFAAKMGLSNIAAGLDTLKWFAEDVLRENIKIENGSIDILKLSKPVSLRTEILEVIQ
ncbi:MAG: o-succinylbenzoate synthase [Planctomycetes bacterium]|nr:o-succinylbenzoate synthase [Planctomycetota bacterium]